MPCASAADDDIVMQTFKKQQHSYRELLKGMQVCAHPTLCPTCTVEVHVKHSHSGGI